MRTKNGFMVRRDFLKGSAAGLAAMLASPAWGFEKIGKASLTGTTYAVSPANGAHAIQSAVDKAKPGDTVLIHAGTYRESVSVTNSGTAEQPIIIAGAPDGEVILTGADVIPSGEWNSVSGTSIWQHTPWAYDVPAQRIPSRHQQDPLLGRTEQVIVDDELLRQVHEMGEMQPRTFFADPGKALYLRLGDDSAPSGHLIEASIRPVIMAVKGSHVVVRNLKFAHATNMAQHAAFAIEGTDNLAEDCVAEWTNGVGALLGGERSTARRLISRFNGQMGMSGQGEQNVMEECRLEDNNVKGYPMDWEAGAIKVYKTREFVIRRCEAVRNRGYAFWFDGDNQDELIEESYAAENDGSGIFVEISETATVRNNLCVRNGLKDELAERRFAGIELGESMRCIVEHNVCVGNCVGIEVRQIPIRLFVGKRFYSDELTFLNNISADNRDAQFVLVADNAFFDATKKVEQSDDPPGSNVSYGATKETLQGDLELLDPDKRGWRSENNLYFAAPGEGLIVWGGKKLPKDQEFSDLDTFRSAHHLEQGSVVADPLFVNWQAGNFNLQRNSPARKLDAGFTKPPVSTK